MCKVLYQVMCDVLCKVMCNLLYQMMCDVLYQVICEVLYQVMCEVLYQWCVRYYTNCCVSDAYSHHAEAVPTYATRKRCLPTPLGGGDYLHHAEVVPTYHGRRWLGGRGDMSPPPLFERSGTEYHFPQLFEWFLLDRYFIID